MESNGNFTSGKKDVVSDFSWAETDVAIPNKNMMTIKKDSTNRFKMVLLGFEPVKLGED
jgi:hypothetical protein